MRGSDHWMSAHLYFEGSLFDGGCDRIIRRVIRPLASALRSQHNVRAGFFVRYSDPAPHIRLRLLVSGRAAARRITGAVERCWASPFGVASSRSRRRQMQWIPYERETGRYGGQIAMPVIERLFDASSQLAYRLLTPSVGADRGERLGRATLAALVFLHPFLGARERVAAFARAHDLPWTDLAASDNAIRDSVREAQRVAMHEAQLKREQVATVMNCLEEGGTLPQSLAAYRNTATEARSALEELVRNRQLVVHGAIPTTWGMASTPLASSLLHMTYNRLGVTRMEEVQLSRLLSECLRD